MEDTSATGSDGSNPWGSVVIIWILTSDFLFQSDRGTVCPWNFVRSEDDGGTGNDILFGTLCICVFLYTDCCGIYRSIDLHRFYFTAIQENEAYQLGEAYAQSMGVNIRFFRVALILLSSILSASVTAFAGPISFVGIAVPYLVKHALRTSKPLVVIPGTFVGGAVFCMICDLIARMAFAPMELNISTVTSIFGAPVVIFMMVRGQKGR